jgi:hypothetical protein
MSDKRKQVDPLPEEFDSYEAAAEFGTRMIRQII